jgi:hypothetical protein
MTIGSSVISVKAIDDDIGQNAEVRYRLKQDLMGDWKTFSVDEITGMITLKKSLNKEIQKIYQVTINASFIFYCINTYIVCNIFIKYF